MRHRGIVEGMSEITLIIIKAGRIWIQDVGITDCVSFFVHDFDIGSAAWYRRKYRILDAGYILVDCDDHIIVSNQRGFSSSHLPLHVRKRLLEWDFKEYF